MDDVEIGSVLLVHRAGECRIAVKKSGAVERREQPLVRVDHKRVGVLDAVVGRPDARREQARAAIGAVDVEPQAVLTSDCRRAGQVVNDARVGRAGRGDHGGQR